MKKVLKAIALFLALTFVLLCAASCGNKEAGTQGEEEIMTEKPAVQYEKVTVKEQVLVDESEVRITLKSLDFDNMDPMFNLFIENKSEKKIQVQYDLIVNGVYFCENEGLVSASESRELEPGKSDEFSGIIDSYQLEKAGITTIKDIGIKFLAFGTLGEDSDYERCMETDFIKFTTSADPSFVQKYNDNGEVVYDKDGVKIVIQGNFESIDNYLGKNVYFENLSEKDIEIKTSKVVINGKPWTDEDGASLQPAGSRRYTHICDVSFPGALAENEVLKSISFVFDVIDSKTQTVLGSSTEYTATF